jgi:hypothetical protein
MFGGSLSAISVGTQAIAARRYAEGKPPDAGAVLVNSLSFSLVAGIAFTLIGYVHLPHMPGVLVQVLGHPPERAEHTGRGRLRIGEAAYARAHIVTRRPQNDSVPFAVHKSTLLRD